MVSCALSFLSCAFTDEGFAVTPRMGSVLMKLADAFEKDFKEAVEC